MIKIGIKQSFQMLCLTHSNNDELKMLLNHFAKILSLNIPVRCSFGMLESLAKEERLLLKKRKEKKIMQLGVY